MIKFLISLIWHEQGVHDPTGKMTLFHDQSDYDAEMLEGFNDMVKESLWVGAPYFTAITPLSWRNCIALQPADLLAYSIYKETDRRLNDQSRRRGKVLQSLLDLKNFGITSMTVDKERLRILKAEIAEAGQIASEANS